MAQIGAVAVELGLDRSNASRMLAAAVAAGRRLAARRRPPTPADARRRPPTPADARRFASYLVRLANQTDPGSAAGQTDPEGARWPSFLHHTIVSVATGNAAPGCSAPCSVLRWWVRGRGWERE